MLGTVTRLPVGLRSDSLPCSSPHSGPCCPPVLSPSLPRRGCGPPLFPTVCQPGLPAFFVSRRILLCALPSTRLRKRETGPTEGPRGLEPGGTEQIFSKCTKEQMNQQMILPSSGCGGKKVSILTGPSKRFRRGRSRIFKAIKTFSVVPVSSPLELKLGGLTVSFCLFSPATSNAWTHMYVHTHRHTYKHIHELLITSILMYMHTALK